jgi:hypothetical protein
MRFLFLTIQGFESDFYGRVGGELSRLGHEVEHVTVSPRAAARHRAAGFSSRSFGELVDLLPAFDAAVEAERIATAYSLSSIRELYWTDPVFADRDEDWCVRRTVSEVLALESLFNELRPDVLVPEVGRETPRVVAHEIALRKTVRTLFLFYTIFPRPLRLYVDTMNAPIVTPSELRDLTPEERREVESFRRAFVERDTPIRPHRHRAITAGRIRRFATYLATLATERHNNEYLRPVRWALEYPRDAVRAQFARAHYRKLGSGRPFVYFPLHDTEDYKIKRVIPQFADQAPIVEQLADALPPGFALVIKEHPLSIGRNRLSFLSRLARHPKVQLVPPKTSSHELIRCADAVAVISSTVGLEALLYGKPVLTMGRPFYSGYGVTVDVDSPPEFDDAVPTLLQFRPDDDQVDRFLFAAMKRCLPGAPVLVDDSDENARMLAESLSAAAEQLHAPASASALA